MKILFIVPYPFNTAPSQRLKFEQYLAYFEKAGVKCIFRPFMSKDFYKIVYKKGVYPKKITYTIMGYIKRIINLIEAIGCDLIYLHLEAAPFGPPIFEYIFRFLNKPIIYDIDDMIFLESHSRANSLIRYLKNPKKTFSIMRISSCVIVVTNYLKRCAEKYNHQVILIPPTVDTSRYRIAEKTNKQDSRVCIGWSGSHSTSEYLYLLEGALRRIRAKYDVKIKVIGNSGFKIDGINIEALDWRQETEIRDLSEFDIGLYPLPKNEWALGKGGGKAFQYMALGIPSVCTRFGQALEFIDDGANGFLADSEDEWTDKISLLIENPGLRRRMGASGRRTIEERYSVMAYKDKYLGILESIVGKKRDIQ